MGGSDFAIIGGGIIGSAIAATLADSGHSVTLIDANPSKFPPATSSSFGWINAHSPQFAHHFEMRLKSMKLWRELKASFPELPVYARTAIDWDFDQADADDLQSAYNAAGHPTQILDKFQLQQIAEYMDLPDVRAIVSDRDMVALPEKIAPFFQQLATFNGVNHVTHSEVIQLHKLERGFEIVTRANKTFSASQVVVAAGCQTENLLSSFDVDLPMRERTGTLLKSKPQPPLLQHLISSPELHCWQKPDGRIIVGHNQAGARPFETPDCFEKTMVERLRSLLPWISDIEFDKPSSATRPEPLDGMPVLGMVPDVPGLYLAVLHSGITLAPLVARLISKQVRSTAILEELVPYSVSRFANQKERIAS